MTFTVQLQSEPSVEQFAPQGITGSLLAFVFLCVYVVLSLKGTQRGADLILYHLSRLWNRLVRMVPLSVLPKKSLGLEMEDLLKGLHSDSPANVFNILKGQAHSKILPGLGNWDNSCYQNSVIQSLASLPDFQVFLEQSCRDAIGTHEDTTNTALRGILTRLNDPARGGQVLWTPSKLKSMSSWQQQDAQEYFSKIMDQMEKDIAKAWKPTVRAKGLEAMDVLGEDCEAGVPAQENDCVTSKPDSVDKTRLVIESEVNSMIANTALPENPLEGFLGQRVACITCGFSEGLSLIPFNCITVPLGGRSTYELQECLDEYTKLETIDDVECSKCTLLRTHRTLKQVMSQCDGSEEKTSSALLQESIRTRLKAVEAALDQDDFSDNTLSKRCQISKKNRVSSAKSRQAIVARSPRNLVIHINRSVFDGITGAQRKNYAQVSFPGDLDISAWYLGRASLNKAEIGGEGEEFWSLDSRQSMLSGPASTSASTNMEYELRAVITHQGRHEDGHYICFRKHALHPNDDGDDKDLNVKTQTKERWWRLSDEDVSPVSESDVLHQGGVFMLFYERKSTGVTARPYTPTDLTTETSGFQESEPVEVVVPQPEEQYDPSQSEPIEPGTEHLTPESARPATLESTQYGGTFDTPQQHGGQSIASAKDHTVDHESTSNASISDEERGPSSAVESTEAASPSMTTIAPPKLRHMRTSRSGDKQRRDGSFSSQLPMVAAT
ncbi:MAG: hypothetical protein M1821_000189 [Bathelium mastoideum]|nr:MAG: hypothetical protein M1821_000189 [Bathelium mastoideum]